MYANLFLTSAFFPTYEWLNISYRSYFPPTSMAAVTMNWAENYTAERERVEGEKKNVLEWDKEGWAGDV